MYIRRKTLFGLDCLLLSAAQVMRRVGKVPEAEVAAAQQPPVAAAAVYGYRNKVQLAFSALVWQQQQQQSNGQQSAGGGGAAGVQGGAVQQGFGLGYFLPGSNSVVLPIRECSLAVSALSVGFRI
jgi:hypothetical protein